MKRKIILFSSIAVVLVAILVVAIFLINANMADQTVYFLACHDNKIYVSDVYDVDYDVSAIENNNYMDKNYTHMYVLSIEDKENTVFDTNDLTSNILPYKTEIKLYKVSNKVETIYPATINCKYIKIEN